MEAGQFSFFRHLLQFVTYALVHGCSTIAHFWEEGETIYMLNMLRETNVFTVWYARKHSYGWMDLI